MLLLNSKLMMTMNMLKWIGEYLLPVMPLKHQSLLLYLVCQQLYYMMPKELKKFISRDCAVVLFFSWSAVAGFSIVHACVCVCVYYIFLTTCLVMVPPNILFHLYKYLFFVCDCIDLKAHIWGFIMQLQMFFPPYHIYVTWLFIMCVFMILFVCIFLKTHRWSSVCIFIIRESILLFSFILFLL